MRSFGAGVCGGVFSVASLPGVFTRMLFQRFMIHGIGVALMMLL